MSQLNPYKPTSTTAVESSVNGTIKLLNPYRKDLLILAGVRKPDEHTLQARRASDWITLTLPAS